MARLPAACIRLGAPCLLVWMLAGRGEATAQALPSEPIRVAGGRLVVSGEVNASVAGADPGYFNFTDYDFDSVSDVPVGTGPARERTRWLQYVRAGVHVDLAATRWLHVVSELRVDHGRHLQPFTAYARVQPWGARRLDVLVGRVPPTFGAFGRSAYGNGNLLIGTPLAYHYLVSLRSDALPAASSDLIVNRGRGWRSLLPVGSTRPDRGLPMINSLRTSEGVAVRARNDWIDVVGSITTGALSNPRPDHDARQWSSRVVARPQPAVAVGVSASRGRYLNRSLESALPMGTRIDDGVQQAMAVDAEYSEGAFLGRAEVVHTSWRLPYGLTGSDPESLRATAWLAEARYRLLAGVQVAGRAEHLTFSHLIAPNLRQRWDAPVTRLELGLGVAITRNVGVKASWQQNRRDGGRVRRETLGAMQVSYWF